MKNLKNLLLVYLFLYRLLFFLTEKFRFVIPLSGVKEYFAHRPTPLLIDGCDLLFHCASIGEYMSVKPLLIKLKNENPKLKIGLSFLSSSGFDNANDFELFDFKLYNPIDKKKNVNNWLEKVNPSLVVISQNEIWPVFLSTLSQRSIPFLLVDSYFNENFKNKLWLRLNKSILSKAKRIFTQNQKTSSFLNNLGLNNTENTGSLRQEQVTKDLSNALLLPAIEEFASSKPLLVLGSVHISDLKVMGSVLLDISEEYKILIAPHDIDEPNLKFIKELLHKKGFSSYSEGIKDDDDFCILDEFGILKYAYQYADIVYIGGGFGKGIHNVLEPAHFEKPILIGPNYLKFEEAHVIRNQGVLFPIESGNEMKSKLIYLKQNTENIQMIYKEHSSIPNSPSDIIMDYLSKSELIF